MRGYGLGYSTPKVPLPGVLTKEQRERKLEEMQGKLAKRYGVADTPERDDPDAVAAAQAAKDAKRSELNANRGGRKKGTKRVKRSKRKTHRR